MLKKTIFYLSALFLFLSCFPAGAFHILLYHNSLDGTAGTLLQCAAILRDGGHVVTLIDVKGKNRDPSKDNWGAPYDQVWDMRFVNKDKVECGSGKLSSPDYFDARWRSKAVSFLNHSGKLFLAAENFQLTDRDEGLYVLLKDIQAVKSGYDPCPPSPRGNNITEGPAFYPVRNGLGPVSFFGVMVGGIPKSLLTGTSFVETSAGWEGDKVSRSIVSGWVGQQLGGSVKAPACARGKLFMVWEASMWPILWGNGLGENSGIHVLSAKGSTRKFFKSAALWLGERVAPCVMEEADERTKAAGNLGSGFFPESVPSQAVVPSSPKSSPVGSAGLARPKGSDSTPETIVFSAPPVNVHMRFADGPGEYRLDVMDEFGRPLKVLFARRIGTDKEAWASWDGLDIEGRFRTSGLYYAVLSKNGRALRKIVLAWTGRNP